MLLGHLTKKKRKSGGDRTRAWLTTKEQMGDDKLTAIWRKASSLLASFDDELVWSMHSTYTRAGQMHVHGDKHTDIYTQNKHTCAHTHTHTYTHTRMCIHKQTGTHTYTPHTHSRDKQLGFITKREQQKLKSRFDFLTFSDFCLCRLKTLWSKQWGRVWRSSVSELFI